MILGSYFGDDCVFQFLLYLKHVHVNEVVSYLFLYMYLYFNIK
jgi:hypothetical protein